MCIIIVHALLEVNSSSEKVLPSGMVFIAQSGKILLKA